MFGFLKRDGFSERLAAQGELRRGDSDRISDDTFSGERFFSPSMDKPAVYPKEAMIFLAQGTIRLAMEGYADDLGWPFEGTPEEYLESVGVEPYNGITSI